MVKFIFVMIELFSVSLTVDMLWAEIRRSRRFSKGVGHFRRIFDWDGASPTNHCWCQKARVIAVSRGMKISAVHSFVTIHTSDNGYGTGAPHIVCLFTPQPSLTLISPTHGGMARLS